MMRFPLGKPILVMILLALASGAAVVSRRQASPADLRVWVFADSHARAYRGDDPNGSPGSLVDLYRRRTGQSVRVELISARALDTRLVSLFSADSAPGELPDLVEIEIGSVGKFFRPPVNAVGFLPLDDRLARSGLKDRIVASRFAPWTKDGVIFGVPHDVHPVTITYRKDLFDAAGIDLQSSATTWPLFQQSVLRLPGARRVELPTNSADVLRVMLLQRGVNPIDDRSEVRLTDPKVAQTIAFYAQLVAGANRIGGDSTPGAGLWTRDLASGNVVAALTPDWRVGELREFAPELSGKLAMIPLPRFDATDAPTSTWGGTMIGIPRKCRQPDRAWDLLTFLYFSPEGLAARRAYTNIVSPMTDTWATHEGGAHPDTYFGGQDVQALYVSLAPHIPRRYVTPFDTLAGGQLTVVLRRAIEYVRERGNADGLEDACRGWLADAAAELRDWIDFGKFEP